MPLEKLSKLNCEKRTSFCALNSPASPTAKGVLMKQPPPPIGSLLGQDCSATRKEARAPSLNGLETGWELDRKAASFNPFRGHRGVGSGSTITSKTATSSPTWDSGSSPRTSTPRSAASSPRKLDKYAVAKLAASLFHSSSGTMKLERSRSQRTPSSSSSSSPRSHIEKKRNQHALMVEELILLAKYPEKCLGGGHVDGSKEESSIPQASIQTSSIQADVIDDIASESPIADPAVPSESATLNSPVLETAAEILHEEFCLVYVPAQPCGMPAQLGGMNTEATLPESPTVSVAALFEDTVVGDESDGRDEGILGGGDDVESEPSDRGDLRVRKSEGLGDVSSFLNAMCHVAMNETREGDGGEEMAEEHAIGVQEANATGHGEKLRDATTHCCSNSIVNVDDHDTPSPPPPFLEDEDSTPCSVLLLFRGSMEGFHQDPTTVALAPCSTVAAGSSSTSTSASATPAKGKVPVVKPTLRKRRRSSSGSSLSALLLQVVRVSEEGNIVVLGEDAAEENSGDAGTRRAGESEPEDAVKSTYSKFVDIEIDPSCGCVELVQHSKDVTHGGYVGWKRHPQAAFFERQFRNSPRRLPPVKINTCSVYEEKTKSRKIKTIRRGRINSYDLDTLKDYLKAFDSFSPRSQTDPTTDPPEETAPAVTTAATAATQTAAAIAAAATTGTASPPRPKMDSNLSTRERSRTFISLLQAPSSGSFSHVEAYRPCSVSILSNPSFSSSHQDKIWEEQAEIYSSGGRGTPGRDDEDDEEVGDNDDARGGDGDAAASAAPSQTLLYNLRHSPLPAFGSIHHQHHHSHHGFNPLLRRSGASSGSMRSPSESGHFMQQIMSRIRGNSPKRAAPSSAATIAQPKSCPTSQLEVSKRRNPWSSCICFSVKS